jgi:hypothetical protein
MTQLIGYNSEGNAFVEAAFGVRYWVETRAPSVQVLLRKAKWDWNGKVILTAPVIVLSRRTYAGVGTERSKDTTPRVDYLNEHSTEAEIEAFARQYKLDAQQSKWCFAALEELSPA